MTEESAGERFRVTGPLLMVNASGLFRTGLDFLRAGESERIFDFSSVEHADSSALALLFGWQRAARERGVAMRVESLPACMRDLAALYGITGLLPAS